MKHSGIGILTLLILFSAGCSLEMDITLYDSDEYDPDIKKYFYVPPDNRTAYFGENKEYFCPVNFSGKPILIEGLPEIVTASAGRDHILALDVTGTVWAWGENRSGQLGDGSTEDRDYPAPVNGLPVITAISAGSNHNLALAPDGTVYAWGSNGLGELGMDWESTAFSTTPVAVPGLPFIVSVKSGGNTSTAIDPEGNIWIFGADKRLYGGTNYNIDRWIPEICSNLKNVRSYDLAESHMVVCPGDGSIWVSGYTPNPALGIEGQTEYAYIYGGIPLQRITDSGTFDKVAAGTFHSMALSDGRLYTWGENRYGQLGDGTWNDRLYIKRIGCRDYITDIDGGFTHSLALTQNGEVYSWGSNYEGQLGIDAEGDRPVLVKVKGLSDVTNITAGWNISAAVTQNGDLYVWGSNICGMCTIPKKESAPYEISPSLYDTGLKQIRGYYSLDNNGNVYRMPYLDIPGYTSVPVLEIKPEKIQKLSDICKIRTDPWYSRFYLALDNNGYLWTDSIFEGGYADGIKYDWDYYAIGNPARLPIDGVIDFDLSFYHAVALKSDGSVWTWGQDVRESNPWDLVWYIPVQITGIPKMKSVYAGDDFSLAIDFNGNVWAWGHHGYAPVDAAYDTAVPVKIKYPAPARMISYSYRYFSVLLENGDVFQWNADSGEDFPEKIEGIPSDIIRINYTGNEHIAITEKGDVWVWGETELNPNSPDAYQLPFLSGVEQLICFDYNVYKVLLKEPYNE